MSDPTPEPTIEPTPQPENRAAEIITDEGKFTKSYIDSLPDDLGSHSIFQKYDNPVDLIKGAINAQGLAGKKAEEFWTSEDQSIVSKRKEIMGVPKDAKSYELNYGEVPEGMQIDESRIEKFKEVAFELGIPAAAAQKLIEWDAQGATEAWTAMQDRDATIKREAEEQLHKEWKGNQYQINIDRITGTLEAAGLEDWIDNPAIANNPTMLKQLLEKVVPLFDDDVIVEARMKENAATLDDSLSAVEARMNAYTGSTNDSTYRNMIKERSELLIKSTKYS